LKDADVATGSLSFAIVEGGTAGNRGAARRGKPKARGRKKPASRNKGKNRKSQKTQTGRKRSR